MKELTKEGTQWVLRLPAGLSTDEGIEHALLSLQVTKFLTMCERHKKYGQGNIAAMGRVGLKTRLDDKFARLTQGTLAQDESMLDTLVDLSNYADILALWELGDWPRSEGQKCGFCGKDMSGD